MEKQHVLWEFPDSVAMNAHNVPLAKAEKLKAVHVGFIIKKRQEALRAS
jgi:hypothetical protein